VYHPINKRWKLQQRFFFPLFKSTQILGGAAYLPEIRKLRNLAAFKIVPFIKSYKFTKYPFKLTFTFFTYDECDMITAGIISSYIMRLMESHGVLQSCDARVVAEMYIKTQQVITKDREGVEIKIEKAPEPEPQTQMNFME
jgi:hypothetical protein